MSIERKIEILEKTIEIFEIKNNFENIKSPSKSPTPPSFDPFKARIFEELRNLRFKTPENITEENNYLEKNNSITTENTEKSEILIMDAEAQTQAINDLTQAIKEIGTFENNVAISLTFYRKDEEDSYEFLKQFNQVGKINRWSDKRKLEIVANSLKG